MCYNERSWGWDGGPEKDILEPCPCLCSCSLEGEVVAPGSGEGHGGLYHIYVALQVCRFLTSDIELPRDVSNLGY